MKKSNLKILFRVVFSCFVVSPFTLAQESSPEPSNFLLPGDIIPESYELVIYTDLNESVFAFSGSVLVKVKCIRQTIRVILNAKDLKIIEENVTVKQDENTQIEIQSHEYDEEVDFYIINLKTSLQAETIYFIYIPYEATLGVGANGYSRSSYTDAEGNIRWMSMTLFDSIYARRAFPCWDDMPYKAIFSISLAHDENLTALSNTELSSRDSLDDKPGWVMSKFEQSPPLPPSNVAFVICDFESKIVELPPRNIQLRVWARSELLYQAELASDTLAKALPFAEESLDMPYPLPKIDFVALPTYGAGSEAFFGLNLIKETGSLFDPTANGQYNKRNVVSAVCGMVHQQWFNNIVTRKGWEGMWLGTGLVDYFEITAVDQLLPDWTYAFHTFANQFVNVLSTDNSKTAHALQVTIENPNEIDQFYDDIIYYKGSCVLRMLSIIIGKDHFQLGVNNFLKEFEFGKADQLDLWKTLNTVTNMDIQGLMDPWTVKPGVPYLFVDVDYNAKTVKVTQERFLYDDKTKEEEAERKTYCWPVALTYTTSIDPNFEDLTIKEWLTCDGPVTFDLDIGEHDWVILNLGLIVPCRINYSGKNWDSILKTLADESSFQLIEVRSRMQIVNDLFAFAASEILDYAFVLNAIMYLQYETDFLPWGVALSALGDITSYLHRTELHEPFKAYLRQMLEPVYAKLGKFGELPEDYYQGGYKYQLTFWSCVYEVDSCLKSSLETLRTWEAVPNPDEYNPIPIDSRGFVYCHALRTGNAQDWEFLWKRYVNSRGPTDKGVILETLGCTRIIEKSQQLLDWSIDPKVFKPEVSPKVFYRVADGGITYEIMVDFFINRFQEIYNYLSGNPNLLGQYLPVLYSLTRTQQELKRLNDFVETVRPQLAGTEESLNSAIESTNYILAWIDKNKPVFAKILQNYLPENTSIQH